jgi:hypothetical protein
VPQPLQVPVLSTLAALVALLSCWLSAKYNLDSSTRLFAMTFPLGGSERSNAGRSHQAVNPWGGQHARGAGLSLRWAQALRGRTAPTASAAPGRARRGPSPLAHRAGQPGAPKNGTPAVAFGSAGTDLKAWELAALRTGGILLGALTYLLLALALLPKSAAVNAVR